MSYQVNEIFTSIQGEGLLMGRNATFIRLQGCTVGCDWCDTKYTWGKGGNRMEISTIMQHVKTNHVVITGGEPTLHNLDPLMSELQARGHYIQLETSGQQWLKGVLLPDWITWSPKERLAWAAPDEYYFRSNEVKWVVDEHLTMQTVLGEWGKMKQVHPVYFTFMPEGCPPRPAMVEKALSYIAFMDYRYSDWWHYSDRLQYRTGVK